MSMYLEIYFQQKRVPVSKLVKPSSDADYKRTEFKTVVSEDSPFFNSLCEDLAIQLDIRTSNKYTTTLWLEVQNEDSEKIDPKLCLDLPAEHIISLHSYDKIPIDHFYVSKMVLSAPKEKHIEICGQHAVNLYAQFEN